MLSRGSPVKGACWRLGPSTRPIANGTPSNTEKIAKEPHLVLSTKVQMCMLFHMELHFTLSLCVLDILFFPRAEQPPVENLRLYIVILFLTRGSLRFSNLHLVLKVGLSTPQQVVYRISIYPSFSLGRTLYEKVVQLSGLSYWSGLHVRLLRKLPLQHTQPGDPMSSRRTSAPTLVNQNSITKSHSLCCINNGKFMSCSSGG